MKNRKTIIFGIIATVVAALISAYNYSNYAYAARSDSDDGGDIGIHDTGEGYEGGASGNECPGGCQDKTVASSRAVAGFSVSASDLMNDQNLYGFITNLPEVSTSSSGDPLFQSTAGVTAQNVQLHNDIDPDTTLYITFGYAQNDGYLYVTDPNTGDRVRTWYNKGDIIGVKNITDGSSWGVNGVKNADAAQVLSDALSKIGANMDNLTVKTVAELTADFNRLIAAGIIKGYTDDYLFFERLKDLGLDKLTDTEKVKLIQELCKAVGGTCKPPTRTSNSNCHEENYWGDTIGIASVQNMTKNTGWVDGGTVWARPGDSIQFKIYYCWGAEAVFADDYHFARTEYWSGGVDNIYFKLSAKKNDNYLFGENAQTIGSSKHVLVTPHNETIGAATSGGVPNSAVDQTGDYEFILYSPGEKDGSNYNCQIFDFSPYFLGFGYQIPGVDTGGCAAISMNGGNMSDVDNSPGVISQTIEYDRIQAWQLYSHDRGGKCDGECNYDNYGHYKNRGTTKERNSLWTKNDNKRTDPYASLDAAKAHGGAEWGIVTKHQNDTEKHEHDCNSASCGRSNPRRNYKSSCRDVDEAGNVSWYECIRTETVAYDSGCNSDGYCTFYSYPGTQYFEPKVSTYTEYLAKNIHPINLGRQSSTASVNVPYSYRTAANSYIAAGDVIYLGETVDSTFTVNILPRIVTEVRPSESYATLVDGFIQAVEFIADDIPGNAGGAAPVNVPGNDLCQYFSAIECKEIWREGPKLNKEGRYRGENYSHNETRAVPDNRQDLVGKKYCVAVGISTADSHGQVDAAVVSGMSHPSAWRISGVSCRTIAKKPNFQVWNGGLYTNGSIKTSAANKNVGVGLGGSTDPTAVFGSWEEYYVVAAKDVKNFASAAALGYNPSLKTRGGKNYGAVNSYCDVTKKTISNTNCSEGTTGRSNINNASQEVILDRIYTRYATGGDNTGYIGKKLNDSGGARYIYKQDSDIKISDVVNAFHSAEMLASDQKIYNCNRGTNALKMCQGESANLAQTTSNFADGTLIIHTKKKVIIDRNICYGNGACSSSSAIRLNNNNEYFRSMFGLPQVLIIAEGGIDITKDATQVDAWLITNGQVNTCTNFSMGGQEVDCKNTLMVNGPVFAGSMVLNRTGGAYPGAGSSSTVLTTDLSNTGSITPGEIFNLRPDTLYWAYSQAQRYTQATVTHTRELAPRY